MLLCVLALSLGHCAEVPDGDGGNGSIEVNLQTSESTAPLLRKITAEEYRNATRDLFAIPTAFEVLFPAIPSVLKFPEDRGISHFDKAREADVATPAVVEAYHIFAVMVTQYVVQHWESTVLCDEEDATCIEAFLLDVAFRGWRRPLVEDEENQLLALYRSVTTSPYEGVSATLEAILESPYFLYFPEFGEDGATGSGGKVALSGWEMATRLSFFLWGSLPDAELRRAAEAGELADTAEVEFQAWRMLQDWRAQKAVNHFYRQLFDWDRIGSNSLDFTEFLVGLKTTEVLSETEVSANHLHSYIHPVMRSEPEALVNQEIFFGGGRLKDILTTTKTWGTWDTAELYGAVIDEDAPVLYWVPVYGTFPVPLSPIVLDGAKRAGILTTLGFLHSHAHSKYPSPVLRGVFVLDRLLCQPPGAPPGAIAGIG